MASNHVIAGAAIGHIDDANRWNPELYEEHQDLKLEDPKFKLTAVLIGHSFVDCLRNYLRKITSNSHLDEFSKALDLKFVHIYGVPSTFTRITFFSIPEAKLGNSSDVARLLDFVKQEQPDVVAVEMGSHDLAGWCPDDVNLEPKCWSKDHMNVLLAKVKEFYQRALQYSSAVGFCKVIQRRVLNDGIPHHIFQTRRDYCGSTLKYGKEINATIATPRRVAFIYYRN